MRISVKEIKDYIKCPLYYKFVHVDNFPQDRSLDDCYKEYIKLSIFFYYFSLIEKKEKPLQLVLKKWESLWFSDSMQSSFQKDILDSKSNDAVIILTNFFKKIARERITPIATNLPYEIIFEGDENIHVTGDIDLIKIVNDRTRQSETQIVSLCISYHRPNHFMARNNLELSLASCAFRRDFKTKESKIVIDHVRSKEQTITSRSGGDFIRAEKIIRNIYKGINERVFYPTESKISCSYCKFKLFCINEKAIN